MLVLTRKLNESILIMPNIKITIVDITNGRAKLGVEAPAEIGVWREELWQKYGGKLDGGKRERA